MAGSRTSPTGCTEHPLSYLLDALTVGSIGASAAGSVGASALKGTEAATIAEQAAEKLRLAGTLGRAAKAAGIRRGLDVLAKEGTLTPLQELARSILPEATWRRVGMELVPFARAANPVTRALTSPLRRLATEPLDLLRTQAGNLADSISQYTAGGSDHSRIPAVRVRPGLLVADERS